MTENIYGPVDPNRSYFAITEEVLKLWKSEGLIDLALNSSKGGSNFIFLEGPPTANGRPHAGHAMTRTVKDTVIRYKFMKGFSIQRRNAGWDCHGLPVELEAEKHFGFKTKKEIEEFGIEKFNDYCRESIFRYIEEWTQVDDLLGFWINHSNAYVTMRNDYIESEWWAMKSMFQKGLLVKDYKIVPYCPRCETSLSSHEVSQGYEEVRDPSVYVKFKEFGTTNRYFLAWTTTPWTLPANEFLAVNPDFEYSLVEFQGDQYYIASKLAEKVLGKDIRVISTFKGSELNGRKYHQLMDFLEKPEGTMMVVTGSHVTLDDGTGIVHTSPAFGADDFEIGKKFGVSILNPVNLQGRFASPGMPWDGMFVKDADVEIMKYLKGKGLLLKNEKILHTYPFCYRCGSPLLYYPLDTWFIRVSTIRQLLMENNQKINWIPPFLKDGRFGNFLAEAKDWALSRNRYWGTPLPIWVCENGHKYAVGSREEIVKMGGKVPEDLHRPFIDDVVIKCNICGLGMKREPYVIDTWFDSGSSPYAAEHYPFNHEFDPDASVPVDFITEAIDQTRGWFYTMHVISSLLFGKNAYRNAFTIDFILDEQGRKMSKSKGNSVFALDLIREFGADPARLFFFQGAPWKPKMLDKKFIRDTSRKILGTISNIYSFFASNANLDGYRYTGLIESRNMLDRWLLSKVNSTIQSVVKNMESFDIHLALRDIEDLIDRFSNLYLRISRKRFWSDDFNQEKKAAYSTLVFSMDMILKMLAPIAPFYSDYMYRKIFNNGESIHLQCYPESNDSFIDLELEKSLENAYISLELVRRSRQDSNIKNRQPLKEILIRSTQEMDREVLEILKPEMNAREVKFISEKERPMDMKLELVLQKAAPILRGKTNSVKNVVENGEKFVEEFLRDGWVKVDGEVLSGDLLKIKEIPKNGYAYAKDDRSGTEVFINLNLDEKLEAEGFAREIIRRIQVMRKEADLSYDARIETVISPGERQDLSLKYYREMISSETLSSKITTGSIEFGKEWDIDGERVRISIRRV
ncbi:isoleucine--tRNA ligase [Oxyplasma meridianum]|uniref:Isoleucine--tRNA ligase n=1 Tax=Oxyplasma meridianum TaxID=3073602 RepID=A0AAX4NGF0_9ARCH